jgi:hypothetical protein
MAVDIIMLFGLSGGEGGIRTHGTVTRTTVFECAGYRTSQSRPGFLRT